MNLAERRSLWGLKCENSDHLPPTPPPPNPALLGFTFTTISAASLSKLRLMSAPRGPGKMFHSHWLLVSIACQFVFTPKLASGRKMPPSFECRLTHSSLFPVLVSYFWIVICSMYSLTFALPSGMSVWCLPYVVLCLSCDFILNTWANDKFLWEFDMPKLFHSKSLSIFTRIYLALIPKADGF